MRVEPLGDRAIRFSRPAGSACAIVEALKRWRGVVDVVVGRDDVGVYFDRDPRTDGVLDAAALASLGALGTRAADDVETANEHVLRVVYDGVDLDDIARATRLSVDEVIARHSAGSYVVDTMGFAPGFAYLDGLDPALVLPRRQTPRPRIAAGSVAIAGEQTAVYPFDSPAGWHIVGHVVGIRMFDEQGALLSLGDRVRFAR